MDVQVREWESRYSSPLREAGGSPADAWRQTMENCHRNWSSLAGMVHQKLPFFGGRNKMPQFPKGT